LHAGSAWLGLRSRSKASARRWPMPKRVARLPSMTVHAAPFAEISRTRSRAWWARVAARRTRFRSWCGSWTCAAAASPSCCAWDACKAPRSVRFVRPPVPKRTTRRCCSRPWPSTPTSHPPQQSRSRALPQRAQRPCPRQRRRRKPLPPNPLRSRHQPPSEPSLTSRSPSGPPRDAKTPTLKTPTRQMRIPGSPRSRSRRTRATHRSYAAIPGCFGRLPRSIQSRWMGPACPRCSSWARP